MPLNLGRWRRGINHPGDKPTGWAYVEEYMNTHDEDMIADFADDIDTLLVFAGLFSAVVTAFAITSYPTLQQDNSQLSVQLLSLVAVRLGSDEPFLNATVSTLPTSSSFQAPASSIVINILWYTSLVLSVIAALFGILAKQWCREYLKWRSVVAPSRENVLVRQMRFEAWEKWKVSAFIAAVPALLETSLVLFLSGLLVFLWTLHNIVAAVLSVVIGLSLVGALVVTVLPAFSPHCPYRSPTGWVLAQLWRVPLRGYHTIRIWLSRRTPLGNDMFRDWRHRELQSLDDPSTVPPNHQTRLSSEAWIEAYCDSRQVSILLRALAWVRRGSDAPRLKDDISQCMQSLHGKDIGQGAGHLEDRLLSTICAWREFCGVTVDFSTMFSKLLRKLRTSFGKVCYAFAPLPGGLEYSIGPFPLDFRRIYDIEAVSCDPWIARRLLLVELDYFASNLDHLNRSTVSADPLRSFRGLQNEWNRGQVSAMALILCLFRVQLNHYKVITEDLKDLGHVLAAIYNKPASNSIAYQTGLKCMVAELLCSFGNVTFDATKHTVTVSISSARDWPWTPTDDLASFAVQVYASNVGYQDRNICHLFVMAADAVLRAIHHESTLPFHILGVSRDNVRKVFSSMLLATKLSLENSYQDCRAYVGLPWIFTFREMFQDFKDWRAEHGMRPCRAETLLLGDDSDNFVRVELLRLLAFLGESLKRRCITGEHAHEEFNKVLELIGNPELPPVEYIIQVKDIATPMKYRICSVGSQAITWTENVHDGIPGPTITIEYVSTAGPSAMDMHHEDQNTRVVGGFGHAQAAGPIVQKRPGDADEYHGRILEILSAMMAGDPSEMV